MADFDPNQMFSDPMFGLAIALMQGGTPTDKPKGLGDYLAQGLQTGQQMQQYGLQNKMQNIELEKQKAQMDFLKGMNQPSTGTGDPNDPTSDPTYQYYLKGAMAGMPGFAEAAQQQLSTTKSQVRPMTPEEQKKYFPQGIVPGYTAMIDGNKKPQLIGESAIKDVTDYDPVTLQAIHHYKNILTGKDAFPADKGPAPIVPGQPLPGPYESVAQQVANYEIKPPTAGSGRGAAYASNILNRAHELNPNFDAKNYDASSKALKDFSTGKQGQGVKSFNVALKHLDTLSQLADALGNNNVPAFNKLANIWKTQTGQSPPASFNAAKQIVGDEIVKAIVGSGGGVADRETAAATINAASSPAQLKQVIETYKQLMVGQLEGLKQQYEQTTFRNDFKRFLSPEALNVMQNTAIPNQSQPQGIPQGWTVVQH